MEKKLWIDTDNAKVAAAYQKVIDSMRSHSIAAEIKEAFDTYVDLLGKTKWIQATEQPFPKQRKEFLVRNDNQGGVLSLVYYNYIHNFFTRKGKYVSEKNIGTHWMQIPE